MPTLMKGFVFAGAVVYTQDFVLATQNSATWATLPAFHICSEFLSKLQI
jgi:hypothetical protein